MIKCGRCGTGNSDEVFFCQFCGNRLAPARAPDGKPAAEAGVAGGEELRAAVHRLVSDRLAQPEHAANRAPARAPSPIDVGPAPDFRLILVHRDGSDGAVYSMVGDQIDIGRSAGDLMFDDPHLAPRHARIALGPNGRMLSALDSRNGIYQRLRAAADLSDGDCILVGKEVLQYEVVPEFEKVLSPAVEDGTILFGTPGRPTWGRLRQVTAAGITRDVYHLSRKEVVLGREQADIVFTEDEFMSRRHAQISLRQGRGRLEDLGSSNGTYLRLRAPHLLAPGDLIRLGDELLRYELA
jgi:pSer/pThr/pTyr-binding forkhead associated (FHA) protein